jgi:DNA-binding transcriptional MocR family regulator
VHVARVRDAYRKRRDAMLDALSRELPEVTVQVPEGGYYLWLTLPPYVDGDALALAAEATGINLIAGSRFFAGLTTRNRAPPRNHVRLSYSFATPDAIDAGISRLAKAYRTLTPR